MVSGKLVVSIVESIMRQERFLPGMPAHADQRALVALGVEEPCAMPCGFLENLSLSSLIAPVAEDESSERATGSGGR